MAARHRAFPWALAAGVGAVMALSVVAGQSSPPSSTQGAPGTAGQGAAHTPANRAAPEMALFRKHVDGYAALRTRLESTLPKLPRGATPDQIDRHQRALAALIASSRTRAAEGDVFTPAGQAHVRALFTRLFSTMHQRRLRETIQDGNPGPISLTINGRYPDDVPLATMPPEVLAALPPLPREIEYRFVGRALILLDARAQLVIDVVRHALPR